MFFYCNGFFKLLRHFLTATVGYYFIIRTQNSFWKIVFPSMINQYFIAFSNAGKKLKSI